MNKIKKYLSEIGRKGGESGKGASKSRGDSEFYKNLRAMREKKKNNYVSGEPHSAYGVAMRAKEHDE